MTPSDLAERGIRIKPLVWFPVTEICTRFKANALGGHMMIVALDPKIEPVKYSAGIDLGGLCFKFILAEYDDFPPTYTAPERFDTIEAAQSAAEADYASRVCAMMEAMVEPTTP